MVTHPTTNRARRTATWLIEPNDLRLHHARHHQPAATTITVTSATTNNATTTSPTTSGPGVILALTLNVLRMHYSVDALARTCETVITFFSEQHW